MSTGVSAVPEHYVAAERISQFLKRRRIRRPYFVDTGARAALFVVLMGIALLVYWFGVVGTDYFDWGDDWPYALTQGGMCLVLGYLVQMLAAQLLPDRHPIVLRPSSHWYVRHQVALTLGLGLASLLVGFAGLVVGE